MYRRAEWTKNEISKLDGSLKTAVEAPPKSKYERYWDEKDKKYKYKLVQIEKVKCPECSEMFYQKRPKRLFCQDFCRIRRWQRLHRAELKLEKRTRIKKIWGC